MRRGEEGGGGKGMNIEQVAYIDHLHKFTVCRICLVGVSMSVSVRGSMSVSTSVYLSLRLSMPTPQNSM